MMSRNVANVLRVTAVALAIAAFSFAVTGDGVAEETTRSMRQSESVKILKELSIDECLSIAMENSRRRPASLFAVAMAEAQHRQALAGYWPQVNLKGAYLHTRRGAQLPIPGHERARSGAVDQRPRRDCERHYTCRRVSADPAPIQLPVAFPGQTINTPPGQIPVPAQDIKLLNPDSFMGSVNATWLLYDGGMRKGLREQAKGWLDARQTGSQAHRP